MERKAARSDLQCKSLMRAREADATRIHSCVTCQSALRPKLIFLAARHSLAHICWPLQKMSHCTRALPMASTFQSTSMVSSRAHIKRISVNLLSSSRPRPKHANCAVRCLHSGASPRTLWGNVSDGRPSIRRECGAQTSARISGLVQFAQKRGLHATPGKIFAHLQKIRWMLGPQRRWKYSGSWCAFVDSTIPRWHHTAWTWYRVSWSFSFNFYLSLAPHLLKSSTSWSEKITNFNCRHWLVLS